MKFIEKIVLMTIILLVLIGGIVFANNNTPGINDVLNKKPENNVMYSASYYLVSGALLFSFVALSLKGFLKSRGSSQGTSVISKVVEEESVDDCPNCGENRIDSMEMLCKTYIKDNEILKAEKMMAQEQLKKYEESIKNFLSIEATLKRSNQALQAKIDKMVNEKENLILEINCYKDQANKKGRGQNRTRANKKTGVIKVKNKKVKGK